MTIVRLATATVIAICFSSLSRACADNWQRDIMWCHHDTDQATGSCYLAWAGNAQCLPGGQGKKCVIDYAIRYAHAGQCQAAFAAALNCQCDRNNSGYGRIESAGEDTVCQFLSNNLSMGSPPGGSYRDSCREATMLGSILTAYCQEGGGGWSLTEIDTAGCGEIWNSNGHLTCNK